MDREQIMKPKNTKRRVLTDNFVKSLTAPEGKRATVFDVRQPGLCIRVTGSGHRRFYVMSRDAAGRQKWAEVKDGNASVATLAKARELAPLGVANIKNGKTAFPKIEAPAPVETYATVVARFIEQVAKPRQRTWKETERILTAIPWADRPMADITKRDAILYLNERVAAGHLAAGRLALSWLKTLWRWAWRQDLIGFPVMDALKAEDFGFVATHRTRFYDDKEVKAIWTATGTLTRDERAFVKLLMLLAVRKGALQGMKKGELDDVAHPTVWTVPPERVKQRKSREHEGRVYVIPLSPLARRVLLPLLAGEGDLVFPSPVIANQPMSAEGYLRAKVRKASGVADWTAHTHRHTVATWLQKTGHDEYDRGLVLNHSAAGVTSGYSHGYSLDRARALLDEWADHVASVVAAKGVELIA